MNKMKLKFLFFALFCALALTNGVVAQTRIPDTNIYAKETAKTNTIPARKNQSVSPPRTSNAYNATSDFSTASNPSGAWSYGYKATASSAFTRYIGNGQPWVGIYAWSAQDGGACCLMVAKNTTGATQTYAGVVTQPADLLNLHPGPAGEQTTVRWTAPAAGTYQLRGRFQGIDTAGTTTNARILHKDAQVWSGNINGFGAQAAYDLSVTVAAGDTIDFAVGYGSNLTYNSDSTGLAATITPISVAPTPNPPTPNPPTPNPPTPNPPSPDAQDPIATASTASVNVTGTGEARSPLRVTVKISPDAGNALAIRENGMFSTDTTGGGSGGGGGTFATNRNVEVNAAAAGYTTFSEAVLTIGANIVTLNINSPVTCSTAITTNKNTTLEFTGAGRINYAAGCNLVVLSKLSASKSHIFSGFPTANLRVHSDIDFYYPEWWGAKGEAGISSFDDRPFIQQMFDTAYYTNVRGAEVGFTYKFGAKGYNISDNLNIRRVSMIEGSGGAGINSATVLYFPANTKGIVFQSSATESDRAGGFVAGNTASHMSKISDIKIFAAGEESNALGGQAWLPTHNLTLSGQNFTRTSGEVMNRGFGYGVGTTVTIGRANWVIEESGEISTKLRPYRSMGCGDPKTNNDISLGVCTVANGVKTDIIHNVNGVMDASWVGMKVRRVANPSVVWKIIAIPNNFNNSNPASSDIEDIFYFQIGNLDGSQLSEEQKPADFNDDIEIFDFDPNNPINTNRPVRVNTFHGIDARAQIWVENVRIRGFNGNGINFDSGLVAGAGQTGYQPNNNNSNVFRNYIYNVAGNGTYARGVNSNQITFTGNDVSNTKGSGFFDISFLGNNYFSNHTSGTNGISYYSEGGVNGSGFFGNYQEGESPCNKMNQYGLWFAGNACFSSDNEGAVLGAGGSGSLRINKLSMVAPNGSRYFVTVGNGGVITTTPY